MIFTIINYDTFSQTSVPGGFVSGIWTLAASPYQIQGNIQVPNDSTLTIQPGVSVEFQGTYKLLVMGRLLAIGTVTDTITFTTTDTNGWRGIRFDNTPNTNDTSKIMYCKVQYGKATGTGNDAYGGGLFFNYFTKAIVTHCSILNCTATNWGGAIYFSYGQGFYGPIITNNKIINNSAGTGGGIGYESGRPIISDNIISNNSSSGSGGGISFLSGQDGPAISNNIISNNFSAAGGGIFSNGANAPPISNNVICNNSAISGGAIASNYGDMDIMNNTIVNNQASEGGACYFNWGASPTIKNTIFWGNIASSSGNQLFLFDDNSDPSFYYCDVQDGSAAFSLNGNFYTGTYQNNINSDPLLVSPSGGSGTGFNGIAADWSLPMGSPCVDTGDPNGTYSSTDIVGNPRVTVCRIDMGAYEYQSGIPLISNILQTQILCNGIASASVAVTGGSAPYTYSWNTAPFQTTSTATNLVAGNYTVIVTDNNGCAVKNSIAITNPPAPNPVPICLVTVDSLSQNNLIVWDKTLAPYADTFLIYRDTANNAYGLVGKVPYDSLSQFVDTVRTLYAANGDPNVSTWRYKLAVKDTCGNISDSSSYHQTLFIQNNNGNFNWNDYKIEGQSTPIPNLTNYLFQRDDYSTGNFVTIQTLSAASTLYTDPQYSAYQSTAAWRVRTAWNIICTPTIKNPSPLGLINTTRSNTFKTGGNPAVNENMSDNSVSVYPNPNSGNFIVDLKTINLKFLKVKMHNVFGQLVYENTCSNKKIEVNCNPPKGIYQLNLETDSGYMSKKIIIQ